MITTIDIAMAAIMAQEPHRRACEARYYLSQGVITGQQVDALCARIAAKRGQAAADRLRQDMRAAWRDRAVTNK
jgi:hypothetical protein